MFNFSIFYFIYIVFKNYYNFFPHNLKSLVNSYTPPRLPLMKSSFHSFHLIIKYIEHKKESDIFVKYFFSSPSYRTLSRGNELMKCKKKLLSICRRNSIKWLCAMSNSKTVQLLKYLLCSETVKLLHVPTMYVLKQCALYLSVCSAIRNYGCFWGTK